MSGHHLPIRYGDLVGKYPFFDECVHLLVFMVLYYSLKKLCAFSQRTSLVITISFALITEIWQGLFSQQRQLSFMDLIFNFMGIAMGFFICRVIENHRRENG